MKLYGCYLSLLSLLLGGLAAPIHRTEAQTAGSVDPSFDVGQGPDSSIHSILALPDGKILVGGDFDYWNGLFVNSLVRLRADGSRDDQFNIPLNSGFDAYGLWRQPDGKILVSGYFDLPGGQHYLARLQPDGKIDETFKVDFDGSVEDVLILADGRLVVVGSFRHLGEAAAQGIVRLQANGELDPTFQPAWENLSGSGESIVPLKNGDYLVAGITFSRDGNYIFGLLRFRPDGTVDRSYDLDGAGISAGFFAEKLRVGPDGSIMLTAAFDVWRLTPEGFLDPGFNEDVFNSSGPEMLLIQPDGRLLAGDYNAATVAGVMRRLVRSDSDGQTDTNFLTQFTRTTGSAGVLYGQVTDPDHAVVAGNFDQVDGVVRNQVARVNLRDSHAPSQIQWNARNLAAVEGENIVTLTVVRDGDASQPASVDYTTVPDTARAGVDFVAAQGVLHFAANETYRRLEIAVHENTWASGNLGFGVELSNPQGTTLGSNSFIDVTLLDNDATIELATTAISAVEVAGTVSLQVGRQGGLAVPAGMSWRVTGGSARPGIDFTPANGVVTFGTGDTGSSILFKLLDNAVAEGTRTIEMELVPGEFAAAAGNVTKATITILDNDLPGFGGDGFNGTVGGFLPLANGNALAYGSFTQVHGTDYAGIVALRPDGRIASSPRIVPSGGTYVAAAAETRAGKLLLAGSFSAINGTNTSRITRLDAAGNVDPTFVLTGAPWQQPRVLVELEDGSILAGGTDPDFARQLGLPQSSPGGAFIKFSTNGTRDLTFETRANGGSLVAVIPVEGGGFLAGGVRVYRDRLPGFGFPTGNNPILRRDVARFLPSGELDPSFEVKLQTGSNPIYPAPTVAALWRETDGKIVVAGAFTNANGSFQPGLTRLSPNGALDPSFDATKGLGTAPVQVWAASRLPQGEIVVLYAISTPFPSPFGGPLTLRRLNPDGSRKTGSADYTVGSTSSIYRPALVALREGQVLVSFFGNQFAFQTRHRFAWLEADGGLGSDLPLSIRKSEATAEGGFQTTLRARTDGRFQIERSHNLIDWETHAEFAPGAAGMHELTLPGETPAGYLRATLTGQ